MTKIFAKFNTRFSYMGSQLVPDTWSCDQVVVPKRTVDTLIEINKIITPFIHALKEMEIR